MVRPAAEASAARGTVGAARERGRSELGRSVSGQGNPCAVHDEMGQGLTYHLNQHARYVGSDAVVYCVGGTYKMQVEGTEAEVRRVR